MGLCGRSPPQYVGLRPLKSYNVLDIGFVKSNISAVHVWLSDNLDKMDSDMKAQLANNKALLEIHGDMSLWKASYAQGLKQSLEIEDDFMHLRDELSRIVESYIRRFPKVKPKPWLSIPGFRSVTPKDEDDTTQELLDLLIKAARYQHNKNVQQDQERDRQRRRNRSQATPRRPDYLMLPDRPSFFSQSGKGSLRWLCRLGQEHKCHRGSLRGEDGNVN